MTDIRNCVKVTVGKYCECTDIASADGCGDLYRYDATKEYCSYGERVAGMNGWHSRGINGAKAEWRAILWGSTTTLYTAPVYSEGVICSATTMPDPQKEFLCCPNKEQVACSSNQLACCPYAAKIPDGKKTTCGIVGNDGKEMEMEYVCCSGENPSVIEIMENGVGTGKYVCCGENEHAEKVAGGNEGEYMCCPEGKVAYNNRQGGGNKCCVPENLKKVSYEGSDGKEMEKYECCGDGEEAWIRGYGTDTATIECCASDKKTVSDSETGIQGCCGKDEQGYLFMDNSTVLDCCDAGKNVEEIREDNQVYRVCCDSGELPIRREAGEYTSSFSCCPEELHTYTHPEDPSIGNMNAITDCCPDYEMVPVSTYTYKGAYGGVDFQMCCHFDEVAVEVEGGKKHAGRIYEYQCCPKDYVAYYSGSTNECCGVKPFLKGKEKSGEKRDIYGCCEGRVDYPIEGVPETEEIERKCCKTPPDGYSGAYWNGEVAECCPNGSKPFEIKGAPREAPNKFAVRERRMLIGMEV